MVSRVMVLSAGRRVTVSSDAGFVYNLYDFSSVEEMELLQEAGFHPLEVIRGATLHAAQAIFEPRGEESQFGEVREGLLADLIIIDEDPIQNPKVLYGTGHVRPNDGRGKAREGRGRQVHQQGWDHLRRQAAPGRCTRDGGSAEGGARDHYPPGYHLPD